MRLIQSLNTNLKKPCIVIALHNTLFFHRGLFKGRSHPKSPCIYLSVLNNLISKSGFQNIAIRRELRMQWRSVYRKEINLTGTFGLFGALKCTTKWDIKPIFSSPRLHLIRPKSLDDYFSKKQYQGDAWKTKCAFVSEIYQPGFADTLTGYIVAITLGKVIFLITLSCYNNKLSGWRIKNESGIFKISSILICQRYAINGLF